MATLQKFKLLATQCAVASSPTRSPTMSPVVHLRRRRTLRMLLTRAGGGSATGRKLPPPLPHDPSPSTAPSEKRESGDSDVRNKLRDLFISSPPPSSAPENVREGVLSSPEVVRRGGGSLALRPLSATFRQRLLRRAWRPVLVGIPE